MRLSEITLSNRKKVRINDSGRSVGLFSRSLPVGISRKLIEELKKTADLYKDKNVRICLHEGPNSIFQNMIILERKGGYYRPHKHLDKGECFHIIEGRMAVFAFIILNSLLGSHVCT